jgi:hypothetical protein
MCIGIQNFSNFIRLILRNLLNVQLNPMCHLLALLGVHLRRCLHFEVGGLEWSNDPESYAGGSIATGRASHAGKVKGDDPDKDTLVLQVGGWA